MKKVVLLVCILVSQVCSGQDIRIIYDLNGCPGNPFIGASAIYMYAGIGTASASSYFDYTSGSTTGTANPLHPIGNNLWEVCVDLFAFTNGTATPPLSATIFNITMYFHDAAGTIFTGQCNGSYLQINNPNSVSPTSLFPTIVNSFKNCYVGVEEVGGASVSVSCNPNPITNSGEFTYNTLTNTKVTLEIFNLLGKKVKTLVSEKQPAGLHSVKWNATSDNGSVLANGYYFYSLKIDDKVLKANKIVIAR